MKRVHLVDADVDQLEAALGGEFLHLGVGVERRPQVGHALARLRRRGLRHADAAVGAVDPVDAEFLEGRHVGQQRMALVHRHRQRAHLALVVDRERRVGHRAVDVAAEHRGGHVAGALERHVGGLDAERRVQALVRGVVGRIEARAAEAQLARVGLGRLDEVLEGLDRARLRHHQRVRRVVKPEHRRRRRRSCTAPGLRSAGTRCAAG